MKSCCKDCNNRTARCHCDCRLYAEYLRQLNAIKQTIKKNRSNDRELQQYEYDCIRKFKKYNNKEK